MAPFFGGDKNVNIYAVIKRRTYLEVQVTIQKEVEADLLGPYFLIRLFVIATQLLRLQDVVLS
jgi:hypothetical protein